MLYEGVTTPIYIYFKTIMMDDDEINVRIEKNRTEQNRTEQSFYSMIMILNTYSHCNYSDLMIV